MRMERGYKTVLSVIDVCQIAMNGNNNGNICSVKKVPKGYLIGLAKDTESNKIEYVQFIDEETGKIENVVSYVPCNTSEPIFGMVMHEWFTEKYVEYVKDMEDEHWWERDKCSNDEIRQQNIIVRSKLEKAGSEFEIEAFMELLTPSYRERISKFNTFVTLTKFNGINVRKVFINENIVKWKEEMGGEIHSDGYVYGRYYTYALFTENDSLKIRRITLHVRYNGGQSSMGIFSCEGEDDVIIRYKDVYTMLEDSLRRFWLPYAKLEKEKVYKLIRGYVESSEPGKWMRIYDDLTPLYNAFRQECLEWEMDDGKKLSCELPSNVYIKKVKEDNLTEDTPEIYMLTKFLDEPFVPRLDSTILIVYKGKNYTYGVGRYNSEY